MPRRVRPERQAREPLRRPEPHTRPASAPGPDADTDPIGIECPNCACRHFEVVRTVKVVNGIRRERACRYCGKRTFTVERTAQIQKSATGSRFPAEGTENSLTESEFPV